MCSVLANFESHFNTAQRLSIYLKLLRESVLFAVQAMGANMLRTILSLLGVTIGITTIIGILTMVDAMETNVRDGVDSLGDNVIYVQQSPWTPEGDEYAWWDYVRRPRIKVSDADALAEVLTKANGITFSAITFANAEYQNNNASNVTVQLVDYDFHKVRSFNLQAGRYFTEIEASGGRNYVIIGDNVRKALFGERDGVGEAIRVKGKKVRVIGVFEREGESLISNTLDNSVLVPVTFGRTMVNVRRSENMIMVKAKQGVEIDVLKEEMRSAMRRIRRVRPSEGDNFALNEASLLSAGLDGLFDFMNKLGWIVGAFSIFIGVFNIANIMFVSVRERTPLIGIQKSLGAKRNFILLQFLSESVILCLFGAAAGLLLVFLFLVLPANLIMDMDIGLSFQNIMTGVWIAVGIGIVSGILPAYAAARMDPVVAIRSNG